MMRISYNTHQENGFQFGKLWFLHGSLEDPQMEFIAVWLRFIPGAKYDPDKENQFPAINEGVALPF